MGTLGRGRGTLLSGKVQRVGYGLPHFRPQNLTKVHMSDPNIEAPVQKHHVRESGRRRRRALSRAALQSPSLTGFSTLSHVPRSPRSGGRSDGGAGVAISPAEVEDWWTGRRLGRSDNSLPAEAGDWWEGQATQALRLSPGIGGRDGGEGRGDGRHLDEAGHGGRGPRRGRD